MPYETDAYNTGGDSDYNNGAPAPPSAENAESDGDDYQTGPQRGVDQLVASTGIREFANRIQQTVEPEVAESAASRNRGGGLNEMLAQFFELPPPPLPPRGRAAPMLPQGVTTGVALPPMLQTATIGVRLPYSIVPPANSRPQVPRGKTYPVQGAYLMEREDKLHRMGDVLQQVFIHFYGRQPPMPVPGQPVSEDNSRMYQKLNAMNAAEIFQLLMQMRNPGNNPHMDAAARTYANENAAAFVTGVRYLNADARKDYRVRVTTEGLLTWRPVRGEAGRVFDTETLSTVFSGAGWGMWVMSPLAGKKRTNRFYSGPHIKGSFHHSSFLEGDNVRAAGEWKVKDGKVLQISSKTGHYKCDLWALRYALTVLMARKVDLRFTQIRVFSGATEEWLVVDQFMKMNLDHFRAA